MIIIMSNSKRMLNFRQISHPHLKTTLTVMWRTDTRTLTHRKKNWYNRKPFHGSPSSGDRSHSCHNHQTQTGQ